MIQVLATNAIDMYTKKTHIIVGWLSVPSHVNIILVSHTSV